MANSLDSVNPENGFNNKEEFDFSVEDSTVKKESVKAPGEAPVKQSQASSPAKQVNVQPQIPGDTAPFIVLCGPPTSGKSMVLKSLAYFLYQSAGLGYTIAANKTLLNTAKYQEDCDYFDQIIGMPDTKMPNTVDYLLADILDNNANVVAHFLEAPGEDFFSLSNPALEPNRQFKGYMEKVAQITPTKNRKVIYIILLDLDSPTSFRNDATLRDKYEKKMINLYNRFVLHHPSRVILLYNKVDLPHNGKWANANGCSNLPAVLSDAKINYPHLFFTKRFLFWDIPMRHLEFAIVCL